MKKSDSGLFPLYGNRRLAEEIAAGGISQQVILAGPKGSGRHTAAKLLAAAAVCTGEGKKPCGCCSHCRKVALGEHPDVMLLIKGGKVDFKVEQLRSMRSDAFIKPTEAERKVYIVEDAQSMNAFGQNALLKVLEEPPEYVRMILMCHTPEELLETVRSRCRLVQMEPLSPEEGEALLSKLFPSCTAEERARALSVSAGFAGAAGELLTDDREREIAAAMDFLVSLSKRSEKGMLDAVLTLEKADREEYAAFLDTLTEFIASALEQRMGVTRPGISEEVQTLSKAFSLQTLLRLRETVESYRDTLRFNVRTLASAVSLCGAIAEQLSL